MEIPYTKGSFKMNKLIKGTHHIAIKCENAAMYEETVRFYREVLELELFRQWAGGTMFSTGDAIIEIFAEGRVSGSTGSVNHFALLTDRVEECVERVRAAGYAVTVEPKDVTIASQPPMPVHVAFVIGPAGEEIEFFQVL